MLHNLTFEKSTNREQKYQLVIKQAEALCSFESDRVANLANITALLREAFGWFWIGFYIVDKEELILGPFQGSVACTRIGYGKGVCGKSWMDAGTIIVEDVEKFEGHIACSSLSRSEIVVPIIQNNSVIAILDIDSDKLSAFDNIDKEGLEKLCQYIATIL